MKSAARGLGVSNSSFERDVDVHRKENQNPAEKETRHQHLVIRSGVQSQQSHRSRETQTTEQMQRDQIAPLTGGNSGGLEFHNPNHSYDEENNRKSNKSYGHSRYISGVAR